THASSSSARPLSRSGDDRIAASALEAYQRSAERRSGNAIMTRPGGRSPVIVLPLPAAPASGWCDPRVASIASRQATMYGLALRGRLVASLVMGLSVLP